jgi:hypothetical protein
MHVLDRTSLAKTYAGRWLALKADRQTVVATGNSAEEALRAARVLGEESPLITRLPRHPQPFIGGHAPAA